ncbi:transposase [Streptomyces sp. NPDC059441]|uniref:transposase n=1 Tax=Streptomyces sp. NPDC059441 TaxID=3346829 RepID=UPI0036A44BB1
MDGQSRARELVTDALKAAVRTRGGRVDDVIIHSDHGAQYGAKAFADACHRAGIRRSMGADNAAAESFFASRKREIVTGRHGWPTERAARLAVFRWLGFYNHRRRHPTIGYLAPVTFEQRSTTLATTTWQPVSVIKVEAPPASVTLRDRCPRSVAEPSAG